MKPDPPSALGGPVGKRSPGGRDHLAPAARDQVPAAGVDDDGSDQERGGDASDDAVADLLEQQRHPAAPFRDVRFDIGGGDGGEQERHADPVVEPALDVQALADPARDARIGDDRLAERGVGRRQDDPDDGRLPEGQLAEDRRRRERTESDGQGQADPEQANRHRELAAQLAEVDAGGVGEEDEGERRLGQRRTVELVLAMSTSSRTSGPTRIPIETKTIAGVIGVPDSRLETAATAISASATIVSDHSI